MHKGVRHVLKPMLESAIKAEVFPKVQSKRRAAEITPKSRTALFQGREDDEPMARQVIQFGSFLFDAKINKMKEGILANTTRFGTKFIFQGINLCKQEMVFHVGSIQVMVPI